MNYQDISSQFSDPEIYSSEIRDLILRSLHTTIAGSFSTHSESPYFHTRYEYGRDIEVDGMHLFPKSFPEVLLRWAKMDTGTKWTKEDLLVLDLETTGLGRGSIIAFMVGLGYYENDKYIVEQLFLPHPDAEINSFDRIIELLETKQVLVTFNGKTFDLPVLESRFLHNQIWCDLRSKEHIDVLHLARRLWKKRAPSCALETLEYYILGQIRDRELDIEGSIIPQTYFQFLLNGDSELIRRIFVHNQHDILNTAALLAMICNYVDFPLGDNLDYRIDYHALAKLYSSTQRIDIAQQILERLYSEAYITPDLLYDLGMMHKKTGASAQAYELFLQGAELDDRRCLHELILLLENKMKGYDAALIYAERLYHLLVCSVDASPLKCEELTKRIARLQSKREKSTHKKPQ